MDGDGGPEATGVDIACGIQECGVHGHAGGADDGCSRCGDVKGEKYHDEDGKCEVATEPFFEDAEEDADDEDFRDRGVDKSVPEVGQQRKERAGIGDGKRMGEVLDEDDRGREGGAEQDAGCQVPGKFCGGKLGDLSFFEALVEEDIDEAYEEREQGAGDGVLVFRG